MPDMDPDWREISGQESVAQQVARAWVTAKGEMHDPTIGGNLITKYGSAMDRHELLAFQADLRQQALAIEGVDDIAVFLYFDAEGTLTIWGNITFEDDGDTADYWNYVFQLSADKIPRFALLAQGE